jgi:glycosyltransferase involved in cell wall biosynthesis
MLRREVDGGRGRLFGLAQRGLRVAQVAPLTESVPPKSYGGTERVVAWLTEALIARGHQVTLFASGDSTCHAPLRAAWPEALRRLGLERLGSAYQLVTLSDVYGHEQDFDIIHTHLDYWSFPFARLVTTPTISTLHGRLDLPELLPVYRAYPDAALVSISDAQRRWLPRLTWVGTVHHGMPADLLAFHPGPGRYLAFLGRISPEKRPDLAIEVARRTGIPLKIAAKVDAVDRDYYEAEIKRLITPPDIEYIGEITDREKSEFLGSALALLFPIDWPEPFGLVMIESLACGTPVIARPRGSVPEVIRHGVTGFVAAELEQLVAAVGNVGKLSRHACRLEFEARFTSDRMAAEYERLYRNLIAERRVAHDEADGRRVASPTGFTPGS